MSQNTKNLIAGIILFLLLFPVFYLLLEEWSGSSPKAVTTGKYLAYNIKETESIHEAPVLDGTDRFLRKVAYVPSDNPTHKIPYYWYEPETENIENTELPLVVVLHGGTGNAYAAEFLTAPRMAKRFPSFVLVPMAPHGVPWILPKSIFNRKQQLPHVMHLIADLINKHGIDKRRIYVIGCSLGGYGVFGASEFYDDVFAAGVSISGAWNLKQAPKMKKMPLLVMAGSNDKIVAVKKTRDMVQALESEGADIQYDEYNMGHNCPHSILYMEKVWDWMFAQRLNTP